MHKPWRLTKQAETSLLEIAKWTYENFGKRQAEAYRDDLIDQCNAISDETAFSQTCTVLIDITLDDDIRFTRIGQHFIVYLNTPDEIIILDFLHARSDLPSKVSYLSDTLPN